MVSDVWQRLSRGALHLLYPPRCSLCGRGGCFLCAGCADALPRADGLRCDACWLPLRRDGACFACAGRPLRLSRLRSALRYEEDVRRLVHLFKFAGQSCLAEGLGALLAGCYEAHSLHADCLVPVPLIGRRRRTRGYNQADLLAREVCRSMAVPSQDLLVRRRFRAAQAGSASAEQRRANVQGAFALREGADVRGRRLLLVDDIATTCSTLDACASVLLAAGAAEVQALTLARED